MSRIRIPRLLSEAVAADLDRHPQRQRWLDRLPELIERQAKEWELHLDAPYEPGGTAAWIAPAWRPDGQPVVLKVSWRHFEAEHEVEGLELWNGDGSVRCLEARRFADAIALLLEQCVPGAQLKRGLGEAEQDVVIARLLKRLWAHQPRDRDPFRPLEVMCRYWAEGLAAELDAVGPPVDVGLVREALALLRELPSSAERSVLLCTDLHAENVLSAEREPWLVIDPKPFVGDPAYDPVQHMLNCDVRLATDPGGMADTMARLLDLDPRRVRLWLFARCAQESLRDATMREPARRLAPS